MVNKALFWSFFVGFCAFCASLWPKNPFNQRNPRLEDRPKGLHSFTFSTLNFKFSSTTVEESLQIGPFCSNKPNFRKSQMNVNKVLTKDYDKRTLGERGKNKPNSNPIQSQYMLLLMKINTRRKSLSYYISQTQVPNACGPAAKKISRLLWLWERILDVIIRAMRGGNWLKPE